MLFTDKLSSLPTAVINDLEILNNTNCFSWTSKDEHFPINNILVALQLSFPKLSFKPKFQLYT